MRQQLSLHYTAVPAQPWQALERLWLPRLPHKKSAQVARLRNASDRNASLLGVALVALACRAIGVPFEAAELEFPRVGKPCLPGGPDFSISHSHGLAACALATHGRIGLDLEPVNAVRATTAARVLAPTERAAIERGQMTPTDAWVMKEAVVKAAGRGIGALQLVRLDGGRASLGDEAFWLQRVERIPSHVVWLAQDRRGGPVRVREVATADFAPLPAAH